MTGPKGSGSSIEASVTLMLRARCLSLGPNKVGVAVKKTRRLARIFSGFKDGLGRLLGRGGAPMRLISDVEVKAGLGYSGHRFRDDR
jgi:hypothetical protein